MKTRQLLIILGLASLLPCLAACRQAPYNASTPQAALQTARAAKRQRDRETFKRILSRRTLEFVQSQASQTKQSVDQFLDGYLGRQDPASVPEPPDREERIDDLRIAIIGKHNQILGE